MTSTIQVELPESLLRVAQLTADREHVSLSQLAAAAISEKLSAMNSPDYLEERARRGSVEQLRAVLSRVPNDPPIPGDEI